MNIALYDPPVQRSVQRCDDVVNTPLASCLLSGYAAASLQLAGFEPIILQTSEIPLLPEGTILVLHLVYQWEYTATLLYRLKTLKQEGKGRHLFVFGFYPSAFYEDLLRHFPWIDGVLVGETEETLVRLAKRVAQEKDWRNTRGVAFRQDGKVLLTPRGELQNLDSLPFPARQGLTRGTAYLLGSRGCYGTCRFCTIHFLSEGRTHWRGRSPENIVEEMTEVRKEWGAKYFYFADPNFFGPGRRGRDRIRTLARMIKEQLPGISFGMECRSDNVEPDLFAELKEAGLREVFLGVESFSERMLRRFRKGLTVAQNIRAVKVLQKLELDLSLGFIMFERGTNLEDIRTNFETLQALRLFSHPSNTAHLLSHRVFLLQGTPFSKDLPSDDYDQEYVFDESSVQALYEGPGRCGFREYRESDV
jgi:anaerobic magnesium-protoporphyrin IX monomethyl ester cyclase